MKRKHCAGECLRGRTMLRSFHVLFITSLVLLLLSCLSKSETPHLEEFIIGKWQSENEATANNPSGEHAIKLHRMEFLRGGKIIWDMSIRDKTLHFTGDYEFMDDDTIKVDFLRYSMGSALWEIVRFSSSPPRDSITIRDANTDDIITRLERVY